MLTINNSYVPDTLPPVIEGFTLTGGIASDGARGSASSTATP